MHSVTKAAIFVGERRWNLRAKDGLDIRLPETNVGNALAALTKLDEDDHLLSRDITAIDIRLPDRVSVRLSEQAAKAREDLLKAQSRKNKSGGQRMTSLDRIQPPKMRRITAGRRWSRHWISAPARSLASLHA